MVDRHDRPRLDRLCRCGPHRWDVFGMAGSEEAVSGAEHDRAAFEAWVRQTYPGLRSDTRAIADAAWQAARSLPVVVTEPWVSADEKMPPFPGYVLIARWYVSENVPNGVWIYYTGYESEMRKPPYETCWFADDDELVPLADTWWKPIGIPPSLSAALNTTTHTADQHLPPDEANGFSA